MNTSTNAAPLAPVVVPHGMGPFFDLGDHRGWVKVSSLHNNGAFLLAEMEAEPGGGVPPHIHTLEDETFQILAGRFEIMIGEHTIEVGPGDIIFAPRNIKHSWYCIGDEPGRAILLVTPGANFEAFAGEMAGRGMVPAEAMREPKTAESFLTLTRQHGIEMLPPGK